MSTKVESADLLIKLYDLRREEVMRKARMWFVGFTPRSAQDITTLTGDNSAYYRMVTTYWDMACSFVNQGAIDEEMFNEANGEHILVFAKIEPFLEELRAMFGPRVAPNIEKLVRRLPDSEARLARTREMLKQMATRRDAEAAAQTESAGA